MFMSGNHDHKPYLGWNDPTIGIGRPLDPDWLNQASEALMAGSEEGVVFRPRRQPGIAYVNPEELVYLAGGDVQTEFETKTQIEALLAGLALSESSLQPSSSDLVVAERIFTELELKRNSYRVKVKIEDKPSSEYPCGYQIEGEQNALREELGLETKQRPQGIDNLPKHFWFRLGLLTVGDRVISTPHEASKVMNGTPRNTPFQAIGPLIK